MDTKRPEKDKKELWELPQHHHLKEQELLQDQEIKDWMLTKLSNKYWGHFNLPLPNQLIMLSAGEDNNANVSILKK